MYTHPFNYHILPTSFLSIFTWIWLQIPWVVTCTCYLNLRLHVLLIFQITLSCVLPFQTLHLLWMRIEPSMELVLHNQRVLSFMKGMNGILNINPRRIMIPFYLCLLCFFLTSLVVLASLISHVYICLRMNPLLIICRIHQVLVHHPTVERTNHSLKIHLILPLLFLEM